MWKNLNLEHLKNAVQEGVKEFSQVTLEGVRDLQAQAQNNPDAFHEAGHTSGSEQNEGDRDYSADEYSPSRSHAAVQLRSSLEVRTPVTASRDVPSSLSGSPTNFGTSAAAHGHGAQQSPGDSAPAPLLASTAVNDTDDGSAEEGSRDGQQEDSTTAAGVQPPRSNASSESVSLVPSSTPDAPEASEPSPTAPPPAQPATSSSSPPAKARSSRDSTPATENAKAGQRSSSKPEDQHYTFNTRSARPNRSSNSLQAPESTSGPATSTPGPTRMSLDLPAGVDLAGTADALPGSSSTLSSGEDIKRAYHDMKKAYDDMKVLLKKSMGECMRLSDEVVRLEAQVRSAQAAASDTAAALKAAKKEAADAKVALASTRKEATTAQRALEKAQANLVAEEAKHTEAASTAELETLRGELAGAVRKAAAAVEAAEAAEARVAAAEAARQEAEAARNEADRLRREAQAEAHAAQAAAEAERNVRAEAQGLTETLKQDQERRARVFNNAVKAAVGKVQRELEAERDELQGQLRDVQRLLSESKMELRAAMLAAEEAHAEAAARTSDAAAAGHLAVMAEQAAERAAVRESEAAAAAHAAEAARQAAVEEAVRLREQRDEAIGGVNTAEGMVAELKVQLDSLRASSEVQVSELEREMRRHQERADSSSRALASAEKQLEQAAAASREAVDRAQADAAVAAKRVEQLEAEVHQLRTSSGVMSMFQLPSKEDVLAGLGLEVWKDDRLRWKSSSDVESSALPPPQRPRAPREGATAGGSRANRMLGHVSPRVWVIVGYLLLLHIAVMINFTRTTDVSALCAGIAGTVAQEEQVLP